MGRTGEMYSTHDEVAGDGHSNLTRTMFATPAAATLGLERWVWTRSPTSLRIVPNDQNTGGFFVAVLHKIAPAVALQQPRVKRAPANVAVPPAEVTSTVDGEASASAAASTAAPAAPGEDLMADHPQADDNAADGDDDDDGGDDGLPAETMDGEPVAVESARGSTKAPANGRPHRKPPGAVTGEPLKEDPYLFLQENSTVWDKLQYAAPSAGARIPMASCRRSRLTVRRVALEGSVRFIIRRAYSLADNFPRELLLSRSDNERKNHVYLVSPAVAELLHSPELARLRILQTGLRVFARSDGERQNQSGFRILQEGLPYLGPYVEANRVLIEPVDLHVLLQCEHVNIEALSPDLAAVLRPIPYGSFFFEFDPAKHPAVKCYLTDRTLLCGWRGFKTAQILVNKKERARILSLFDHVLASPPAPVGKAKKTPAAAAGGAAHAASAAASGAATDAAAPARDTEEDAMVVSGDEGAENEAGDEDDASDGEANDGDGNGANDADDPVASAAPGPDHDDVPAPADGPLA